MYGYHMDFLPAFLFALPILIALAAWTIVIKGFALWKAARNGDKWWFIVLLVVNTAGILELIYLFWYTKRGKTSAPAAASSAPEA